MPNQTPLIVEQRIVAFSLGHPALGPRRIAAMLARAEWRRPARVAQRRVEGVARPRDLHPRQAPALIAGYRAPYEPPREPEPEPRIETNRLGELVGIDCFFVGRLSDTRGAVWQITAIDTTARSLGLASCVPRPRAPTVAHTTTLARRVARDLQPPPRAHRTTHSRAMPRRPRLRCPQD